MLFRASETARVMALVRAKDDHPFAAFGLKNTVRALSSFWIH